LRELATERANFWLLLRPQGAFSQNATLPVAFTANDGVNKCDTVAFSRFRARYLYNDPQPEYHLS